MFTWRLVLCSVGRLFVDQILIPTSAPTIKAMYVATYRFKSRKMCSATATEKGITIHLPEMEA